MSTSTYRKAPAAPPPTVSALTLFAAWSSSTLPPVERASSVPAVIGAAAVCVMLPPEISPIFDAVSAPPSWMLPPSPFCSVSALGTLSGPTTLMSAACALLPATMVGASSRVNSSADTAKPVAAVPPSVIGLAVRSTALPAASTPRGAG